MINEVIKDLKAVDESSTAVYKSYDYIVKAIDILEALKPLEVNDYKREAILKAFEDGDRDYVEAYNSYNWNANIDHHMQWYIVKVHNRNYMILSFHRFGDVRCNYTDEVVLSYDDLDRDDFDEALYNSYKDGGVEVDGKDYTFEVSCMYDNVRVIDKDGNDFDIYPDGLTLEDIVKAIKEKAGQ
jgi:hypothetical protein